MPYILWTVTVAIEIGCLLSLAIRFPHSIAVLLFLAWLIALDIAISVFLFGFAEPSAAFSVSTIICASIAGFTVMYHRR
jgi:hypothetical protein